ncbi:MAG: hypothetical protein ACREPR_13110 [Brasilonema sp.]
MTSRQHSQTKNTRKYSSTLSSASTGGMFESRPFVVQASRGENSQQPDLKTSPKTAQVEEIHSSKSLSIKSLIDCEITFLARKAEGRRHSSEGNSDSVPLLRPFA